MPSARIEFAPGIADVAAQLVAFFRAHLSPLLAARAHFLAELLALLRRPVRPTRALTRAVERGRGRRGRRHGLRRYAVGGDEQGQAGENAGELVHAGIVGAAYRLRRRAL